MYDCMVDFTSDLEAQLLVTKRLQAGRDWEVEQLRESNASLTSQLEEKDQKLASLQHQLSEMNKVCSAHMHIQWKCSNNILTTENVPN